MKRILSTLLVMMLLFSCTLVSVQAATPKITLNEPTVATFTESTDELLFKFETTSNDSFYRISLKNISVFTPINASVNLHIYDKYDEEVENIYIYNYINNESYVDIKLKRNNYYYIKIRRWGKETGNVRFSVKELIDDIPDTMSTAKAMTLGKKYVKEITAEGDVDYYKFTTTSNDSFYRIKLKNNSVDCSMELYVTDKYEEQLKELYTSKNYDTQTDLKLEPKKTYYLYVKPWDRCTGKYEVSVTEIKDDAPNKMEKAVKLYSDMAYIYGIDVSDDVDWFRWTANTNKLKLSVKNYTPNSYLYFEVYDKHESRLAHEYVYTNHKVEINADVKWGEKYYIKVYYENGKTGDYKVSIGYPAATVEKGKAGKVKLYAVDGRTKYVDPSQIAVNEKVGWYTEPVQKLYTPDGRSKYFVKSQVNAQLAVGWYTQPVQRLYAEGKSKVFPKSQVSAQLKVGWYTYPVQRLYAKGGRSKLFPQSQVSAQLKVGWYTYPVY